MTDRVPHWPREAARARQVDAERVLLFRLGPWCEDPFEIEPGKYRRGIGYREGMPLDELVDATRAWWRIDPERVAREGICHAVAVYRGLTRGVMVIEDWIQGENGRWAFSASPLTHGPVHEKWVGRLGRRISFRKGSQSPFLYWPPV